MNTKLWVDDLRNPPDDTYDIARTYVEAITLLLTHQYDEIFLDHDLGCFKDGREFTGYDVVMWIVQRRMDGFAVPVKYHMLTMNPIGRTNMLQAINRYLTG